MAGGALSDHQGRFSTSFRPLMRFIRLKQLPYTPYTRGFNTFAPLYAFVRLGVRRSVRTDQPAKHPAHWSR